MNCKNQKYSTNQADCSSKMVYHCLGMPDLVKLVLNLLRACSVTHSNYYTFYKDLS